MIRGTESKGLIFNKLQELYPNAFWEDTGKILRIPMAEGGVPIEIKVTLTAAKNILGGGQVESAFPTETATASAPEKVIEMTEEEKSNVSKLLASLNLNI